MPEMKVTIEAVEPMELMRSATREKVWFRLLPASWHWPEVEIRGEQEEIYKFISLHWGEEEADARIYDRGPLS